VRHAAPGTGEVVIATVRSLKAPRIDVHSHFFPPLTKAQSSTLGIAKGPWLRDDGDGTGFIMAGDDEYRPVERQLWDPHARLAQMDQTGVSVQVISATPILFSYAGDARHVAAWASMINDQALEMCGADPLRLRPLCQVPLQDIDASCREVSRAVAAGHVGVHIGNHVNGRNLEDPDLMRFLFHCADENIPVLIHPWDTMAPDRMSKYMMEWLVGMPAETHLAILSLILSGAFERLPQHLRLCFAHGGGNFAAQIGRVDNAWRRRDIVAVDCPNPPSSYADRFSVDSAVFSDDALRLLVSVMGTERILMGSDYPYPLGEEHPGTIIDRSTHLSPSEKSALLYDNASAFFGVGFR
jgi:aminocarboxymuconate-semialdehyde decarboxylase